MSIRSDITAAMGWHRYEAKELELTVLDDDGEPVPLTALTLEWRLFLDATMIIALEKVPTVTTPTNVARVAIAATDYEGTIPLLSAVYQHQLWDRSNNAMLTYGLATILPGSKD